MAMFYFPTIAQSSLLGLLWKNQISQIFKKDFLSLYCEVQPHKNFVRFFRKNYPLIILNPDNGSAHMFSEYLLFNSTISFSIFSTGTEPLMVAFPPPFAPEIDTISLNID